MKILKKMKKKQSLLILTVVLLVSTLAPNQVYSKTPTGKLKVIVSKLRTNTGLVNIGLYNTKESYLSRGTIDPFKTIKVRAKNNKAKYTFKRLPFGEYTIKVYHDENGNGKIDLNKLKIPVEPYGFSNNARGISLPKYSQAKFNIDSKKITMELNLINKFSRKLTKTDLK